jgi:hypothetical protein
MDIHIAEINLAKTNIPRDKIIMQDVRLDVRLVNASQDR